MNKRLILTVALVICFSTLLTGCQKQPPEGVNQEFYDDMIFSIKDLESTINNLTNKDNPYFKIADSQGYKKLLEYSEGDKTLTITEQKIVKLLENIYMESASYYDYWIKNEPEYLYSDLTSSLKTNLKDFSNNMGIKIDVSAIIL